MVYFRKLEKREQSKFKCSAVAFRARISDLLSLDKRRKVSELESGISFYLVLEGSVRVSETEGEGR